MVALAEKVMPSPKPEEKAIEKEESESRKEKEDKKSIKKEKVFFRTSILLVF